MHSQHLTSALKSGHLATEALFTMALAICLSPPRRPFKEPLSPDIPESDPDFGENFMLSDSRVERTAVSATAAAPASVVDDIPVEVLVEIFRLLRLGDAFSLAATSRRFARVFELHKVPIVLSIIRAEFSPFNSLLQVVKASAEDARVEWGTWLDKRVRYKNTVLCEGGRLPAGMALSKSAVRCAEATINDGDLQRIIQVCKVVRGWERRFPQHRFHSWPSSTRSLNARENERLRAALYNWMRYAYYFHGDLPRPNRWVPAGRDVRLNQLRMLSNSQLRELKDLWLTVEDIVELRLCPSIDNVRLGAVSDSNTCLARCRSC